MEPLDGPAYGELTVDALDLLAREAQAGDEVALRRFVDASYDQVWRLCAAVVDEQGADDLAQETFVRAVRALSGFSGRSSARTWLLAVARNTCMDELRARTRRRRRDRALAFVPVEAEAPDASRLPVLTDLLSRIEPDRRTAFVLTRVLGLDYREAADVCACPVGTIRSRVARARADLVALIEGAADAPATSLSLGPGTNA